MRRRTCETRLEQRSHDPLIRRDDRRSARTAARTVFQYLGLIPRPAQIALTGIDGRIVYDFRDRRARVGSEEWRRPEDLDPDQRSAFLHLIHTWERMMLARRDAASAD